MSDLKNKVAVVTGGTRGIGPSVANPDVDLVGLGAGLLLLRVA